MARLIRVFTGVGGVRVETWVLMGTSTSILLIYIYIIYKMDGYFRMGTLRKHGYLWVLQMICLWITP